MSRGKVANVVEIFSGIQGEGLLVGRRQVFLRLACCNLKCAYCDQPEALDIPRYARVQLAPESDQYQRIPNPLTVAQVIGFIERLHRPGRPQPALAVTGGEPLLQADFLSEILPALREKNIKALLDTNGTLPDEMLKVGHCLNAVAMDIKLTSGGGPDVDFGVYRRFMELARNRGLFVKVVICADTSESQVRQAAKLVRSVDPGVIMVLQPVSPVGKALAPTGRHILELERAAADVLKNVRVIPQIHKQLGLH